MVFLLRYLGRDEDAEMPDRFVERVDDGLTVGADIVDAVVEIQDPVQRLLRRRDVVTLGANTTMGERILRRSIRCPSGSRIRRWPAFADEQAGRHPLDFLAVKIDVDAPPIQFQVARHFGIDLGVKIESSFDQ